MVADKLYGSLREKTELRRSQRNLERVRSIVERWTKGDFSVSRWADEDIDYCGPDLRGGRGIAVMTSQWHGWLSSMDGLAVAADRFLPTGPNQVLVLARFSCAGDVPSAPIAELAGVCLFELKGNRVVRLSLFAGPPPS